MIAIALPKVRTVPQRFVAPLFFFCATFIFASLVPFDVFYANRSAKVTAHIGSITVPPSVVQQIQEAAGLSPVYKDKLYRAFRVFIWYRPADLLSSARGGDRPLVRIPIRPDLWGASSSVALQGASGRC